MFARVLLKRLITDFGHRQVFMILHVSASPDVQIAGRNIDLLKRTVMIFYPALFLIFNVACFLLATLDHQSVKVLDESTLLTLHKLELHLLETSPT